MSNTNKKTMSQAEVDKLFEENSVLFGYEDGIPLDVAGDLFGDEAVRYAVDYKYPSHLPYIMTDYFKTDKGIMYYLTKRGVYIAASYKNIVNMPEKQTDQYRDSIAEKYLDKPGPDIGKTKAKKRKAG